uniref:Uncharacterized protein n=1 Tax=Saimiri boliviensis boliviensis TaxID=39432 RepID=A0A2K6UTK2_SAIBB
MKQVHSSGLLAPLGSLWTLSCIPGNGECIIDLCYRLVYLDSLNSSNPVEAWLSAQRVPLHGKAQSRWVGALLFDLGF